MKSILAKVFLLTVTVTILFACEKENIEPSANQRTVFMYFPWSSNLLSYFQNNISDMENAIRNNGLKDRRVIVFLSTSPSEAQMFEINYKDGNCSHSVLKEYTNPRFTTEPGLTEILNDMKTFAPAPDYSMIIGCHGMGWIPVENNISRTSPDFKYHWEHKGVPQTRFFGGLSAEYQTDISTLAQSIAKSGLSMEYILFDDCYMSSLEVAYELRHVTDYVIACPTEIMVFGMPYSTMGKYLLMEKPDYKAICDTFYHFYSTYQYPYGTLAVTDCGELDNLATLMKQINEQYTFDFTQEHLIQRMDGYTPVIFYDYGDYVKTLCGENSILYRQFTETLNKVVPYKTHTEKFYSASQGALPIYSYSGITTSEPSYNRKAKEYNQTSWYKDTH